MEHLKGGGKAPGFALKPQVKNRRWLDDVDFVAKPLKKVGLAEEKIWQHDSKHSQSPTPPPRSSASPSPTASGRGRKAPTSH